MKLGVHANRADEQVPPPSGFLSGPLMLFASLKLLLTLTLALSIFSCGRKQPVYEFDLIIANGKVISGRGCEPEGSPAACVIMAHDARTGRELWRRRTIAAPGEEGGDSWGDLPDDERWHVGSWMVPSYDPELNLVFAGTSVTSPAPKFAISGNDKKYLYHNSTLALNADTGEIVWYYQHIVDHWDLDHPFERLLVETAIAPDAKEVAWINPKITKVSPGTCQIPTATMLTTRLAARPTCPQSRSTIRSGVKR